MHSRVEILDFNAQIGDIYSKKAEKWSKRALNWRVRRPVLE